MQPQPQPADRRHASSLRWIALAVLAGLALRVWEAWESSLWLDETHSLFHASRPDVSAVLDTVGRDFHAPLFFLFLHACGDFAAGAWLRWIPIVSSMLTLVPLLALARESRGGERAAVITAWLFAALPYQVHYGAELRPYAWVGLLSATAAWAAFSERGGKRASLAVFFVAVLLGTLTHRVMVMVVAAIGAARLFVRRPKLVGLPALIVAGTIAILPALPWMVQFANWATEKRDDFEEAVGGRQIRPQLLREVRDLPLRLVEPYIGSLGGPWTQVAYAGLALLAAALAAGAFLWWRGRRRPAETGAASTVPACIVFGVVQFVLITAFSLYSWDRVPLQYFAGMAWVIPLALGAWFARLERGTAARVATAGLVVAGLVLGAALAGGSSREDFRRAVAVARAWGAELQEHGQAPLYTAVLGQPSGVFEHVLPYRAYGPDLGAIEPEALPKAGADGFERHVIVIRRALNLKHPHWVALLAGRKIVREVQVHERVWVYELAPQ